MFQKQKFKDIWNSFHGRTFILVTVLLLFRLFAMFWIPLNDSTEARYAEIARLMLSTNNWVSLMHYPNQYFWAKPPLSTWLSAISMYEFGVSAWAARLPALFLSIACLGLVARMARSMHGYLGAVWSIGILVSTFYFLLDAGTVMTDPTLLTCVSLVMVSFWLAVQEHSRFWGYMTFVGWGLGLLAKGLAMGVFTVLPIICWLIFAKQWKNAWHRLPWIKGSFLTLAIALPWYILAERRMPGFLSYFIVGEHFMRFMKPGWTGDLYGFAHQEPMGMIWIYFALGTLPWSGFWLYWLWNYKSARSLDVEQRSWYIYLLSFAFTPILFFTFARNIIYPYVFPVLPAFALLVTSTLIKVGKEQQLRSFLYRNLVAMGLLMVVVVGVFNVYPVTFSKSTDQMILMWKKHRHSEQEHLIYALRLPEYSAMFYSNGEVLALYEAEQLCQQLKLGPQYLVLNSAEPAHYQSMIQQEFKPIEAIQHRQRIDSLYYIDKLPSFCLIQ